MAIKLLVNLSRQKLCSDFFKKSDILNFSKIITGKFSAFYDFAINACFRRKNFFLKKIFKISNCCKKYRLGKIFAEKNGRTAKITAT